MEPQITLTPESTSVFPTEVEKPPKKVKLNLILSILLVISSVFAGYFYFQTQKLSNELLNYQSTNNPDDEITATKMCVDKDALNCEDEPELSFECTSDYQDWANENCPNWQGDERITCPDSRPLICTMECIENPPYICGSNGSSYCSTCQACSNTNVDWYVTRDTPCEEGFPL